MASSNGAFDYKAPAQPTTLDFKKRLMYQPDNKQIIGAPIAQDPLIKMLSLTPTYNLTPTCYGSRLYAAIRSSNVYTSPDGITWTARTVTGDISYVLYISGLFVAMPSVGTTVHTYYTSSDGITWNTRTATFTNLGTDATVDLIKCENNTVGVYSYNVGYMYTTNDGINWTSRTMPTDINDAGAMLYPSSIVYSKVSGLYTAMIIYYSSTSYPTTPQSFQIYTSPTLATWTFRLEVAHMNNGDAGTRGPNNIYNLVNGNGDLICYAYYNGAASQILKLSYDGGVTWVSGLWFDGTTSFNSIANTVKRVNSFLIHFPTVTTPKATFDGLNWFPLNIGWSMTVANLVNTVVENPMNIQYNGGGVLSLNPYQSVAEKP